MVFFLLHVGKSKERELKTFTHQKHSYRRENIFWSLGARKKWVGHYGKWRRSVCVQKRQIAFFEKNIVCRPRVSSRTTDRHLSSEKRKWASTTHYGSLSHFLGMPSITHLSTFFGSRRSLNNNLHLSPLVRSFCHIHVASLHRPHYFQINFRRRREERSPIPKRPFLGFEIDWRSFRLGSNPTRSSPSPSLYPFWRPFEAPLPLFFSFFPLTFLRFPLRISIQRRGETFWKRILLLLPSPLLMPQWIKEKWKAASWSMLSVWTSYEVTCFRECSAKENEEKIRIKGSSECH